MMSSQWHCLDACACMKQIFVTRISSSPHILRRDELKDVLDTTAGSRHLVMIKIFSSADLILNCSHWMASRIKPLYELHTLNQQFGSSYSGPKAKQIIKDLVFNLRFARAFIRLTKKCGPWRACVYVLSADIWILVSGCIRRFLK